MKHLFLPLLAALALTSCKPQPIDIHIPQQAPGLSISSACPDEHSVFVSVCYSASSLVQLLDTTTLNDAPGIPRNLLIDSAIVTIASPGTPPDTLRKLAPGVYGRRDLHLLPGNPYTLSVLDYTRTIRATATTSFMPLPTADSLLPVRLIRAADTLVRLRLSLRNADPNGHYFISYNTVRNMREHAIPLPMNTTALHVFAPKQIALFTGETTESGTLRQDIVLQVSPSDTVFVQLGQIDRSYYDYLAAYKRSGALINQLTGEPINLPGNIRPGYGYFSLYVPLRQTFDLNRY